MVTKSPKPFLQITTPEYRKSEFIKAFIYQTLLQFLTFGMAITVYHQIVIPNLTQQIIPQSCPIDSSKAGG